MFFIIVETLCRSGWKHFEGACYKFTNNPRRTWRMASKACKANKATLLSIHSSDENDFIHSIINIDNKFAWIGLSDLRNEGQFVWEDGTSGNYRNWRQPTEPNNTGGKEDCAFISHDKKWNDVPCSESFPYICKYRLTKKGWFSGITKPVYSWAFWLVDNGETLLGKATQNAVV